TVVVPSWTARSTTSAPIVCSIRATLESPTLHVTDRPYTGFPAASRRITRKPTVSPAATVSFGGSTLTEATGGGAITTSCAVPLLPSLVAVTTADPAFAGRNAACGPYEDTIRARNGAVLVNVTSRPWSWRPVGSGSVAEKETLSSPTCAVSFGGDTVTEATGGGAITTSCAVPLLPSLVAVTTADPGFAGRNAACGPYEDTIRATLVSLMVHVTIRPESCRPWASRSVAEKKTLSSPTTTVSAGGVTLTEATGGGAVTTSCAEALLRSEERRVGKECGSGGWR